MEELLRTNNPVLISVITASLEEAGIQFFVADQHASIMDGSIGAIPRRILVDADHIERAKAMLEAIRKEEG